MDLVVPKAVMLSALAVLLSALAFSPPMPLTGSDAQKRSWIGFAVIAALGAASLVFDVANPTLIAALFGQG